MVVTNNTVCILPNSSLDEVEVIGKSIMLTKPKKAFEFLGNLGLPGSMKVG